MADNILVKSLQVAGLDEFTAQLYLLLIQNHQEKIAILAKKLDTYRLKIYEGLENLENHKLLKRTGGKIKSVEPPQKVVRILKSKANQIQALTQNLSLAMPSFSNQYYAGQKNL